MLLDLDLSTIKQLDVELLFWSCDSHVMERQT